MTALASTRSVSVTHVLRAGLILVVLASLIPYGAVDPLWFYVAALLNGLVFAGTLAIPFRNMELLNVYRNALIVLLVTGAYLFFQSLHFPNSAFSNPIWGTVREMLGFEGGAISVNPAGTVASIGLIIHPFLIFMATLVLHQSDDSALSFWHRLSLIGAVIAAFGLIQYLLFPGSLLFGEKLHYTDSVTGTFVNRNSAATLFGMTALLLAGTLALQLRQLDARRDRSASRPHHDHWSQQSALLYYAGLLVVVLLALFLTKSRAGLVATFVPLFLVAVWQGYSMAPVTASTRLRVGLAGTATILMVLVFAVLGARTLFRVELQGAADLRWCAFDATIAAIKDNPWLGTGFGTFDQVFPGYRDPECGISGVWDRAHNFFLEGYLGMGLPFAVILAFVLAYLLHIFLIGYRTRRRFIAIPLIGIGLWLLVVLHSMVDFSLQIPGVAAYLAAALGAAVVISLGRNTARQSWPAGGEI